jgi:hypothetical protein
VLLLLAVLALISGIGGQEVRAGVLLGVAVAIKPTWALYALFFFRKRWWTATAVAAATGGVLGLAPFALVAGDEFRSWLAVGSYYGSGDYAAYPHNQSVNGVLLRAFVGSPLGPPILESPVAARGLWVGAVIGAIWLWSTLVSAAPAAGPRAAAEFAATVVLVLFASPLSEDIHFAVVVLPLAVLLDHCVWAAPPRWWGALAVATCAYFAQPLLEQIFYWEWTTVQRIVMGIIYLAGLLLVAVALVRLLRSPVRGTVRTRELQSFGRTGTFLRRRSGPV